MTKKITDTISLRPLKADEEDFWREVFYDSVRSHFEALQMPDDDLNRLLEMQFQAQSNDYGSNYPNASNSVIEHRGVRVGRVILSTEHNDLHLVDIAILTEFRGRGIGTRILAWLCDQSRASGLPIRFYVEKLNPAARLYERMGFKVVEDLEMHFRLSWSAETAS